MQINIFIFSYTDMSCTMHLPRHDTEVKYDVPNYIILNFTTYIYIYISILIVVKE